MKGLISGIKRMEIHDGDGLRTTVFFKGCPLRCLWCHNPESIGFDRQVARFEDRCIGCGTCRGERTERTASLCPTEALVLYGREYGVDELVDAVMQDRVFYERSGGGVTLSGGECLAQPAFAVEVARKLSVYGISVYVDTCGYVKQEVIDAIIPYTDVFLYDIKAIDSEVHKRCTGRDNAIILQNLKHLSERGCTVDIRYPLVMGYNDGECEKIGRFLQGMRGIRAVKVLQYHPFAASRYLALGMEPTMPDTVTTPEDVGRAVDILRGMGLNAVNGITDN